MKKSCIEQHLRAFLTQVTVIALCLATGSAQAQQQGEPATREERQLEPQRAMIEAVHGTAISSELSGRIEDMPFREGDNFEQGDVIVSMDCALYIAERDRVGAKLASARRQLENDRRLAELRSVGQLEVDLSRLAVSESNAEYRAAQTNVRRCSIEAPYAGRVVHREASEGQSVNAQEKLLEIVGRELEARIIVPATWLAWLEPGVEAELAVEETGDHVTGTVRRIGASVDPVSHTIPVWTQLDVIPALRPGMSASATFPSHDGEAQTR